MQGMFERLATLRLRQASAAFPVVSILGARQVGKTTLARAAFPAHRYIDLEDPRPPVAPGWAEVYSGPHVAMSEPAP